MFVFQFYWNVRGDSLLLSEKQKNHAHKLLIYCQSLLRCTAKKKTSRTTKRSKVRSSEQSDSFPVILAAPKPTRFH